MILAGRFTCLLLCGLYSAQVESPFAIKHNVDLVVLHATVRDRGGSAAVNLQERDFRVFEDGAPQSIRLFRHEDTPVTVGLVVDHSGSMRTKLAVVVKAAETFVQFSSPADEMFVVNFNEKVTLGLASPVKFTNRQDVLARAIDKTPAAGTTALYDAVAAALEQLKGGSHEKHVLIVISDGEDNASSKSLVDIMRLAVQSNAVVYTIGVFDETDQDRNPAVLKRLARATGGEAFIPNTLQEVASICKRIASDIRHQYTIGYFSNSKAPVKKMRQIRVTAESSTDRKLTVRTRSGYLAGDPP